MKCLVTGGAGFIGSHLCRRLLDRGDEVVCLDNFNDYYDPLRKQKNISLLSERPGFRLEKADIRDKETLAKLFATERFTHVAHLAAMAGPRFSIQNPSLYQEVNTQGTLNLLEESCRNGVRGFFLASTSSVYGRSPTPWSEASDTEHPLSPYAATKKAAEVLAYTFHSLYGLPVRIARFFTVYGPKGRPDMTPYLFVKAMEEGRAIDLFEGGHNVYRDWTFVDDIVSGVVASLDDDAGYDIFNLGNSHPIQLIDFISALERTTGLKAKINTKPLPATDPPMTYADTSKAKALLGFEARTNLEEGLERFWSWYKNEA